MTIVTILGTIRILHMQAGRGSRRIMLRHSSIAHSNICNIHEYDEQLLITNEYFMCMYLLGTTYSIHTYSIHTYSIFGITQAGG